VKGGLDNVKNIRTTLIYAHFMTVEPGTYGLQKGKYPQSEKPISVVEVKKVASDFFDNFCGDLDTYLDGKKGLRKEMLKYL
jgi:hypothetical protein